CISSALCRASKSANIGGSAGGRPGNGRISAIFLLEEEVIAVLRLVCTQRCHVEPAQQSLLAVSAGIGIVFRPNLRVSRVKILCKCRQHTSPLHHLRSQVRGRVSPCFGK